MVAPWIEYLLKIEDSSEGSELGFRFDRIGDGKTLVIHCIGWENRFLWAIEAQLIKKYGLNYDFDHCKTHKCRIHTWDKTCGRTFIYLREPG